MSARKSERRRAARARARERSARARLIAHVEREFARWRCDARGWDVRAPLLLGVMQEFVMVARGSDRIAREATRQGVTGDRLALRAALLARVPCVVLSTGPVQSTARVAIIVDTSDTVIPTGERDGLPVTWVYDGDSIDTYRRVRALRGER